MSDRIYGFDFGTTNSLAAVVTDAGVVALVDQQKRPHPSVVCFVGGEAITGHEAREMLEGAGLGIKDNVVPSPKRLLAYPGEVVVDGEPMDAEDIVGVVLRSIREDANGRFANDPLDRVVMTIPVSMDGRARRRLRQAALRQGIEIVQFVHEPLAALYASLRGRDEAEFALRLADLADGLVLVIDWGGGTLDLTLCTYAEGMLMQIQNLGDDRVGGDLFDEAIMNLVLKKHIEAHGLPPEVELAPGARQKLRARCELAKIRLSQRGQTTVVLEDCIALVGDGPEKTIAVALDSSDLHEAVGQLIAQGVGAIDRLLAGARRDPASVRRCLLVGGMANVPEIQQRIAGIFDASRIDVSNRGDRLIAEGAAWIAHDRARLGLPKPFEIRLARETCAEIVPRDTVLPLGGSISQEFKVQLYCTDPRDGAAALEFIRPLWPGRAALNDERLPYALVRVPVDPGAGPMMERLEVSVRFTEDLIAVIEASAAATGQCVTHEVHDLEFGLRPGTASAPRGSVGPPMIAGAAPGVSPGQVILRANVTRARNWTAVPGDLFRSHGADIDMTDRQREEALYYQPCSICDMTMTEVRAAGGCGTRGCPESGLRK